MQNDDTEQRSNLKAEPDLALSPQAGPAEANSPKQRSKYVWVVLGVFIAIAIFALVSEPGAIPYRFAAALNGAIFGGIGGGVGAALEYFSKKRFTGKFIAIGAFVGLILSHGFEEASNLVGEHVYKTVVEPKVDALVVANNLINDKSTTVFKTLHAYEPEIFNAMVSELVANARSMADVESSINAMRAKFIEPIIARKARYLPDDDMMRYASLIISEMQTYKARKPELCVAALRGKPLGDVRPYLDPEQTAGELSILEAAIKADKRRPWPIASEQEQSNFFQTAIPKLSQTYGDDVRLFQATTDARGREPVVCTMSVELFRQIVSLPSPANAQMMRAMIVAGSP